MKQKVVIEVQLRCEKCRSKALKIAAVENGVTSVAIKGESANQIEVIGDGIIDAARLAERLRKKVGNADIVSVEEVKENDKSNGSQKETRSGGESESWDEQPETEVYQPAYDYSSPSTCPIM